MAPYSMKCHNIAVNAGFVNMNRGLLVVIQAVGAAIMFMTPSNQAIRHDVTINSQCSFFTMSRGLLYGPCVQP
jgi:hypothetical protein